MITPYSLQPCSYGTDDDSKSWEKVIDYLNQERERMEEEDDD